MGRIAAPDRLVLLKQWGTDPILLDNNEEPLGVTGLKQQINYLAKCSYNFIFVKIYSKQLPKTNPIGVRFDDDIIKSLKENYAINSNQGALNFLSDFYRETINDTARFIHIYKLINPINNSVFYIGQTTRPIHIRLSGHVGQVHSKSLEYANQDKNTIIKEILSAVLKPKIELIEKIAINSENELDASKKEVFWIEKYIHQGYKLTNRLTRQLSPSQVKKQILKEYPMGMCKQCGKELSHLPGRKKKAFCDANCRNKYFYALKTASKSGNEGFVGTIPAIKENIAKGNPPAPNEPVISPELKEQIVENNKPENKARILKERNFVAPFKSQYPLDSKEVSY